MSDKQTTNYCPLCEDAQREIRALNIRCNVMLWHIKKISEEVQKALKEIEDE
jgi:hypothetical protein